MRFLRLGRRLPRSDSRVRALGFVFHVAPDDEHGIVRQLRSGAYEPAELALFQSSLRPGMTVVDIGANVGVYTLVASRAVGDRGRVVAFEPDPQSFAYLTRNIAANGRRNVVAVARAVAASAGEAALYRLPGHLELTSLSRANARGSAAHVLVELTTLDSLTAELGIERVDFLKLDAQGAELEIVRGGRKMLSRDRPSILFELWVAGLRNFGHEPGDLLDELVGLGYALRDVAGPVGSLTVSEIEERCRAAGGLNLLAVAR